MRRALRLLPMRYKPSEVAALLHVPAQTLYRTWVQAGMPCERDESGNLWIVGTDLRAWIDAQSASRRTSKKVETDAITD
jgi:hypothetical protein